MDVLDLEVLEVADQVDVAAVQADALLPALADAEDVMDVEEHALANVVPHALADVEVDALADVEDVVDVQDAEDLVLAHAHQVEKDRLVLLAMVVLDAPVHVLRVLRAVDVVGVMDVVGVAAVHPVATAVVAVQEDAMDHALEDVREDVVVAQGDALDVLDVVLDAMAHVLEHVMAVVMAAVGNAKTHVLPPAQQHALEPAKLKHLAL